MAGPLTGIGAGVTVPQIANNTATNTQNNQINAVQQNEDSPQPGASQSLAAAPSETADTQTQNTDVTAQEDRNFFAANQSEDDVDTNAPPGSLVDITV